LMRDAAPPGNNRILIAPSWGDGNLIDTIGEALIEGLLEKGYHIILRPHPGFFLNRMEKLTDLKRKYEKESRFKLENSNRQMDSLFESGMLITDYSGIAFEYSILHRRPVCFTNVAKKVLNPNWQSVCPEVVEVDLREKLGFVAEPVLEDILEAIARIQAGESQVDHESWDRRHAAFLFDDKPCAENAVNAIKALLNEF